MKYRSIRVALAISAACWLLAMTGAPLRAADNNEWKGLIVGRTGETLILKTANAGNVTIVLTDDTKVQQPRGVGIRKKDMSAAVLIPGLKIAVKGTIDASNRVVADTITFSGDDLKTAQQIEAGLTPTQQAVQTNQEQIAAGKVEMAANRQQIGENQQQIQANQQEIEATNKRFSELTDYDTKGELNVYFASGSTAMSENEKAKLTDLSRTAVNLTGYLIQVKGYADSSGNAAMNQKLSMERAQEVVAYLIQNCNVPIRHVVAPGAMGEAEPAATNETAQGRAENRRVEVKVLVNRGLGGQ